MSVVADTVEVLSDPEVKRYFVSILDRADMDSEAKYRKFQEFFKIQGQIRDNLLRNEGSVYTASTTEIPKLEIEGAQRKLVWDPDKILAQTKTAIERGIMRLRNCQHRDGGWGRQVEISNLWDTAYSILCLNTFIKLKDFDLSVENRLKRGMDWFKNNSQEWMLKDEYLPFDRDRSFYDVSMVIKCFYEMDEPTYPNLDETIDIIARWQNADGGWDAGIWRSSHSGMTRVFSDVGATSFALQSLALKAARPGAGRNGIVGVDNYNGCFERGLAWLISIQNEDGSWSDGSCIPGSVGLQGNPSVTKTCDAIKAIYSLRDVKEQLSYDSVEKYKSNIDRAVEFILNREKPLYDASGALSGWGWEEENYLLNLDPTASTLYTLVLTDACSTPLLAVNAEWLMKHQWRDGTVEDGKWEPLGHTPRVLTALMEFYKRIRLASTLPNIE